MKKFRVVVNNKEYLVKIEPLAEETAADETIKQTSSQMQKESTDLSKLSGSVLEAPLRGSILSVLVKPGERVKTGQVLITLEALKLENEISAPCDAVVEKVLVNPGDQVDLGDTLLTYKSE